MAQSGMLIILGYRREARLRFKSEPTVILDAMETVLTQPPTIVTI